MVSGRQGFAWGVGNGGRKVEEVRTRTSGRWKKRARQPTGAGETMAKGVVKLGTGVGRRARNDGHSHTVSGPGSDGKEFVGQEGGLD